MGAVLNAIGLTLGAVGSFALIWVIPSPEIDEDGGLTFNSNDKENLLRRRMKWPCVLCLLSSFLLQIAALFC